MSGAIRKMAVYLGLVEDDARYQEDVYDFYEEYSDDESRDEASRLSLHPGELTDDVPDEQEPLENLFGAVFDLADQTISKMGSDQVEARLHWVLRKSETPTAGIVTLNPRTYNEARTIGEHFREGTPVILNLTEMIDSDAKRLVDFSAGLIFGLRGSIERVTNKVFLLSPAKLELTPEGQARSTERDSFNKT